LFTSQLQTASACRILLAFAGMDALWSDAGPTELAVRLLESGGGSLSLSEFTMLRAAFEIWNRLGHLTLGTILDGLTREQIEALTSLLVARARGTEAIDVWIAANGGRIHSSGTQRIFGEAKAR
jgi:hypothetical protein